MPIFREEGLYGRRLGRGLSPQASALTRRRTYRTIPRFGILRGSYQPPPSSIEPEPELMPAEEFAPARTEEMGREEGMPVESTYTPLEDPEGALPGLAEYYYSNLIEHRNPFTAPFAPDVSLGERAKRFGRLALPLATQSPVGIAKLLATTLRAPKKSERLARIMSKYPEGIENLSPRDIKEMRPTEPSGLFPEGISPRTLGMKSVETPLGPLSIPGPGRTGPMGEGDRGIGGPSAPSVSHALSGRGMGLRGGEPGGPEGGDGPCMIVTACHGRDSEEVRIAREYRDTFLDEATQRGYYFIAEGVVPRMEKQEDYHSFIKENLIDHLISVARYRLQMTERKPSEIAERITKKFLNACQTVGILIPHYRRSNGEIV